MVKVLQIFSEQKDGKENKFPDGIKIYDFSYSGSRMAIPSLSATLKYHECLDSKWDYSQYVEFRGEKYWVSKIPSSTKDNTDHRYKHDITFLSERSILSNVYFYDVIDAESEQGKYHSNSSSVLFYGTLSEFISRINASLRYSGINYSIVLDNAINNDVEAKLAESKEFSCENAFVLDVLNQAYETWDIPFYFIGKVCHFGYFSYEIDKEPLQYGVNNSLLKIERTNANTRIVTRATGVGSTENIPFYYPNDSEKGNFTFETDIEDEYEIIDHNKLANSVDDGVTYTYTQEDITPELDWNGEVLVDAKTDDYKDILVDLSSGEKILVNEISLPHDIEIYFTISGYNSNVILTFNLDTDIAEKLTLGDVSRIFLETADGKESIKSWSGAGLLNTLNSDIEGGLEAGGYRFRLVALNVKKYIPMVSEYTYGLGTVSVESNLDSSITRTSMSWWKPNNDTSKKISSLKSIGIDYNEEPPHLFEYNVNQGYSGKDINKKFTLKLIEGEKLVYQERLMPSLFSLGTAFGGNVVATTKGVERYYDAKNNTYPSVLFKNELNGFNRSEKIYQYDDIKPEIKNVRNTDGYLIHEIADVAFDDNDSDATLGDEYGEDSNKYAHPYFYIKLRKTDAANDFGFNLFNRATEKDSMTIQMTSGNLNGCKFKIQVVDRGNNTFKNPVQVDEYGNIVSGDKDKKISLSNFIESQQDTRKSEVWIAVLKDQDTFGVIMPNVEGGFYPRIGDTFNITGIHLPKAYIIAAQELLDKSIVADMAKENVETFNHSIDFSRIFLKEDYDTNKDNSWASLLNETVKIPIIYDGNLFYQYVSSYTYECRGAELLPKITVELSNTIAKSETFEENIVRKSTSRATRTSTRVVFNSINEANYATTKSVSLKANQSDSLEGYGIKDAYIKADGTIVLGKNSIKPATSTDRIESLDWSQITNKPDYFEEDGDGNIKVKNGKGLYSDSFISAGGVATEGGGGTGGGMSVSQMWAELAKKATSTSQIIDDSHIPSSVARITDLPDMTKYVEKGDMGDFLTKDDLKWKNITD